MSATPENPSDLRRRAEAAAAETVKSACGDTGQADAVHELLVHQIELEMQNEELRRLQASLAAERARYFELFDLAPVGYVLLGAKNLILEANLSSAHQLGLPRERLCGLPFSRVILPEDQDAFYLMCKKLLASREPQTCELRLLKAGGTPFWAWLQAAAVAPAGAEDAAFRVSISDITEAVKTREALAHREQEYRLLAENASDVVFRCSKAGIIEWVAPSVITRVGWKPEELTGRRFRDIVHPDDSDTLTVAQASLDEGTEFAVELRIRVHGDGYRWFSVSMRAALDDAGAVTHLVGGWQDIQQVVQTRNALKAERTRLRSILDTMFDPHVMLEPVRDDRGEITDFICTDANDAACRYNKIERADFVGRRLREIFPAVTTTGLFDIYREALEAERPVALDNFVYPHEVDAAERRLDIRAVRVGGALSFAWRDVTDRYLLAQKLAASEEHYRLLTANSYDTAIRIGDDLQVLWVSPSLTALLGWDPQDWIGRQVTEFVAPEAREALVSNVRRVAAGAPVVARYPVRAKDGSAHWAESRAMPYLDAHGHRDGLLASFHLIDAQVSMERELERRARTDELTDLLNRKEIFERIESFGGKHPRTGQAIAVLFCDMDRFKQVNDTYGHAAGDEVLRVMSDRIRACLRSTDDLGARVGGDELLVVLHGVQDLASAVAVAEKLRASAAEPIAIPGGTVLTTVSIGVALARGGEKTGALVARADEAMYRAKQTGRNQVISIEP